MIPCAVKRTHGPALCPGVQDIVGVGNRTGQVHKVQVLIRAGSPCGHTTGQNLAGGMGIRCPTNPVTVLTMFGSIRQGGIVHRVVIQAGGGFRSRRRGNSMVCIGAVHMDLIGSHGYAGEGGHSVAGGGGDRKRSPRRAIRKRDGFRPIRRGRAVLFDGDLHHIGGPYRLDRGVPLGRIGYICRRYICRFVATPLRGGIIGVRAPTGKGVTRLCGRIIFDIPVHEGRGRRSCSRFVCNGRSPCRSGGAAIQVKADGICSLHIHLGGGRRFQRLDPGSAEGGGDRMLPIGQSQGIQHIQRNGDTFRRIIYGTLRQIYRRSTDLQPAKGRPVTHREVKDRGGPAGDGGILFIGGRFGQSGVIDAGFGNLYLIGLSVVSSRNVPLIIVWSSDSRLNIVVSRGQPCVLMTAVDSLCSVIGILHQHKGHIRVSGIGRIGETDDTVRAACHCNILYLGNGRSLQLLLGHCDGNGMFNGIRNTIRSLYLDGIGPCGDLLPRLVDRGDPTLHGACGIGKCEVNIVAKTAVIFHRIGNGVLCVGRFIGYGVPTQAVQCLPIGESLVLRHILPLDPNEGKLGKQLGPRCQGGGRSGSNSCCGSSLMPLYELIAHVRRGNGGNSRPFKVFPICLACGEGNRSIADSTACSGRQDIGIILHRGRTAGGSHRQLPSVFPSVRTGFPGLDLIGPCGHRGQGKDTLVGGICSQNVAIGRGTTQQLHFLTSRIPGAVQQDLDGHRGGGEIGGVGAGAVDTGDGRCRVGQCSRPRPVLEGVAAIGLGVDGNIAAGQDDNAGRSIVISDPDGTAGEGPFFHIDGVVVQFSVVILTIVEHNINLDIRLIPINKNYIFTGTQSSICGKYIVVCSSVDNRAVRRPLQRHIKAILIKVPRNTILQHCDPGILGDSCNLKLNVDCRHGAGCGRDGQ